MQNIEVDLLNKAREIVFASRLSESEKLMIMDRLPFAGNMILKMFVEVCEEDPFSIDYLVKNLKAKLDTQGNLSKISEIIKVEHIELDELLSAA